MVEVALRAAATVRAHCPMVVVVVVVLPALRQWTTTERFDSTTAVVVAARNNATAMHRRPKRGKRVASAVMLLVFGSVATKWRDGNTAVLVDPEWCWWGFSFLVGYFLLDLHHE